MMIRYVLGFAFDTAREHVVLICKERPSWQHGRWNGVGGHVEPGEDLRVAMSREFEEETGVLIPDFCWDVRGYMDGKGWQCHVLTCNQNVIHECKTVTDEEVHVWPFPSFQDTGENFIENVPALMELCLLQPAEPSMTVPQFHLRY